MIARVMGHLNCSGAAASSSSSSWGIFRAGGQCVACASFSRLHSAWSAFSSSHQWCAGLWPCFRVKCEDQMYPDATVLRAKINIAKERVPKPCAPQVPRQPPASCRWRTILYVSELLLRGGHPCSKVCPQGQQRQRHAAQPKEQAAEPQRQHRAQAHLLQSGC